MSETHEIDLDEQISNAKDILSRTDNWISACDNKASITFGFIGALFAVIFATDTIKKLYHVVLNAWGKGCVGKIYDVILIAAFLLLFVGLIFLAKVLIPRINEQEYKEGSLTTNSILYFGTIAGTKFTDYKKAFCNENKEQFLNDLLSQVHINSMIALQKHKCFTKGMRLSIIGLIAGVIVLGIGIICFGA